MPEVVMPRLSDSMEEGTVLKWLKRVGEAVAVGEELVEVETDKANMAYQSDLAGTLTEILVAAGDTVPIGTPIARVGAPAEAPSSASAAAPPSPASRPSPFPPPSPAAPPPPPPAAGGGSRPKASPLARRVARERGLDLSRLRGSGPGGRIVRADVEAAGAVPLPAPAVETAKGQVEHREPTRLQSTIARRMAESKATVPHFYLSVVIDMSRAVVARAKLKAAAAEGEPAPSFNDMVVKACGLALREHPRANGSYRDGRFELHSRVNVGVAVAARDALVVPTVFDADRKGLGRIAAESRALARRVREGKITPPELAGATFAVSNLGMYGVESFQAVIDPPQAAILAVGAIAERPCVREGALGVAATMSATLSCDHRILYGADAARFLARVRALLEEPALLAL